MYLPGYVIGAIRSSPVETIPNNDQSVLLSCTDSDKLVSVISVGSVWTSGLYWMGKQMIKIDTLIYGCNFQGVLLTGFILWIDYFRILKVQ